MKQAALDIALVLSLTILAVVGQAQERGERKRNTVIKLSDPHPGLPTQLLPQAINNRGEIIGHIGDEHDGTGLLKQAAL
jgi:hypothetical protein